MIVARLCLYLDFRHPLATSAIFQPRGKERILIIMKFWIYCMNLSVPDWRCLMVMARVSISLWRLMMEQ
jgi:hypothetical protein